MARATGAGDDYDFSPRKANKMSELFSDESKKAVQSDKNPSLLFASVAYCYKIKANRDYEKALKLAVALVGDWSKYEFNLFLYLTREKPVALVPINSATQLNVTVGYVNISSRWSILLTDSSLLHPFIRQLVFAKFCSQLSRESLRPQMMIESSKIQNYKSTNKGETEFKVVRYVAEKVGGGYKLSNNPEVVVGQSCCGKDGWKGMEDGEERWVVVKLVEAWGDRIVVEHGEMSSIFRDKNDSYNDRKDPNIYRKFTEVKHDTYKKLSSSKNPPKTSLVQPSVDEGTMGIPRSVSPVNHTISSLSPLATSLKAQDNDANMVKVVRELEDLKTINKINNKNVLSDIETVKMQLVQLEGMMSSPQNNASMPYDGNKKFMKDFVVKMNGVFEDNEKWRRENASLRAKHVEVVDQMNSVLDSNRDLMDRLAKLADRGNDDAGGYSADDVKKIMNKIYNHLRNEISKGKKYEGNDVLVLALNVIKTTTVKFLTEKEPEKTISRYPVKKSKKKKKKSKREFETSEAETEGSSTNEEEEEQTSSAKGSDTENDTTATEATK